MSSNKITRVRLEVYASQLKNVAGAFKGTSDPYAVVTQLPSDPREKPKVLGKTEVIKNTLCPKWTTHFELDYEIGRLTRINVGIYDEIRKSSNKAMGSAFFEVGEVLGARGNVKAKKLRRGGTVYVRITAAPSLEDGKVHLAFRGIEMKTGLFSKSSPFFEISAKTSAAGGLTWQPIYRSKPVMNDLNPKWPPFSMDISRLCKGNLDQEMLVSVYDWQKQGKHQSMGCFETSVNGLLHAKVSGGTGTASSVNTSKAFVVLHKGKEHGKIVVTTALVEGGPHATTSQVAQAVASAPRVPASISPPSSSVPAFSQALDRPVPSFRGTAAAVAAASNISHLDMSRPTAAPVPFVPEPLPPPIVPDSSMYTSAPRQPQFVDYLTGGCELEMCVAIDFTGSNGDPRRPGTLHYLHPDGQLNDYEKALTAVGSVIARYDTDQMFPVWGFGAKYGGVLQHCFQVGNASELSRLGGVLEAYRQVFRTGLVMSGPTVFSEVINFAAAKARSQQEQFQRIGKQSYKILLILTDGAVSNVDETKQAMLAASDAPLSIVMVGIGDADFRAMRFLDDFAQSSGCRDICQFVEFNRYKHDKSALTRETLAEIPDQLVGYFYGKGIMPLPPVSGSQLSLAASEADEEEIDLNININDQGEISVANYNGPVYDDTRYDTISTYHAGSAPSAPVQPMAPPGPAAYVPNSQPYHQPAAPAPSAYHPQSQASAYKPYAASVPPSAPNTHSHNSHHSHAPHATHQQSSSYGGAAASSSASPIFHVQVPPGVRPGQQLQVRNPTTQQLLLVTVPPGVQQGGKFAVRS